MASFLYALEVGEADFPELKRDQRCERFWAMHRHMHRTGKGSKRDLADRVCQSERLNNPFPTPHRSLLVDFGAFPAKLVEMIQGCCPSSSSPDASSEAQGETAARGAQFRARCVVNERGRRAARGDARPCGPLPSPHLTRPSPNTQARHHHGRHGRHALRGGGHALQGADAPRPPPPPRARRGPAPVPGGPAPPHAGAGGGARGGGGGGRGAACPERGGGFVGGAWRCLPFPFAI